MIVYATAGDLATWLSTAAPADADVLLRSASIRVAKACMRNPYTDSPDDAAVAPLRDATCAQAASWIALGIDPAKLGLDPSAAPVKKSSILGADVERDTTGQAAALLNAANELCAEAVDILTTAGLLWLAAPVGADEFDPLPQWGTGRPWWPSPEPLSGELERSFLWP